MRLKLAVLWILSLGALVAPVAAEDDPAGRIIGTALVESRAYEKLTYLSDRIGHRLSGSAAMEQAVAWTAAEFKRDGIEHVWTEKVMVPHWVRGDASARITAPIDRPMTLLALGGSVGTAEDGVTADVVEVSSFEELDGLGESVAGKIVLFNLQIQRGFDAEIGYGAGSKLRVHGPSRAAGLGAVATLIRSLGTASFRLPHTGTLHYAEDQERIPAAAISSEDADLIHRLLASGDRVRVELKLGCRTLPDAPSANVLAEIRGRERPEEIVVIAAHLDSWDVGDGAIDDGSGCVIVMETMRLLKSHGWIPRRTIRAVLYTNEENGLRGGTAYVAEHADEMERHVAAIESDSGGAAPVGFGITAGPGGVEMLREITRPLATLGAGKVLSRGGGADIGPMKAHGAGHSGAGHADRNYRGVSGGFLLVHRPENRCAGSARIFF